jgi:hypothetical protein
MSDIFISHVEEDAAVAEALAAGLAEAGYEPWYYERDSVPGAPYVVQVLNALSNSRAVVVVLSRAAFASQQVDKEIIQAHEGSKPFVPVLLDIDHAYFRAHKPDWAMMMGAATSVGVPPEGAAALTPRIVAGLEAMGLKPGQAPALVPRPAAAAVAPAPAASAPAKAPGSGPRPALLIGGAGVAVVALAGALMMGGAFGRGSSARVDPGAAASPPASPVAADLAAAGPAGSPAASAAVADSPSAVSSAAGARAAAPGSARPSQPASAAAASHGLPSAVLGAITVQGTCASGRATSTAPIHLSGFTPGSTMTREEVIQWKRCGGTSGTTRGSAQVNNIDGAGPGHVTAAGTMEVNVGARPEFGDFNFCYADTAGKRACASYSVPLPA